jgi:hypothetical protein
MTQKRIKPRIIMFATFCILTMMIMSLGVNWQTAYAATNPVRVPAHVVWVNTGVYVEKDETISLVTRGKAITAPLNIYHGAISGPAGQDWWGVGCGENPVAPEPCALNGAPYGALVGRIGPSGEPFLIGGASSFIAPATGELYLIVNDNLEYYYDNLAGFTVLFKRK